MWSSRPGANINTIHWQATTEANFITKPKPASWEKPSTGRPKPTKKFTTTTPKPQTSKTPLYPVKPHTIKPHKQITTPTPSTVALQVQHLTSSMKPSTIQAINTNVILDPTSSSGITTTAASKNIGSVFIII